MHLVLYTAAGLVWPNWQWVVMGNKWNWLLVSILGSQWILVGEGKRWEEESWHHCLAGSSRQWFLAYDVSSVLWGPLTFWTPVCAQVTSLDLLWVALLAYIRVFRREAPPGKAALRFCWDRCCGDCINWWVAKQLVLSQMMIIMDEGAQSKDEQIAGKNQHENVFFRGNI